MKKGSSLSDIHFCFFFVFLSLFSSPAPPFAGQNCPTTLHTTVGGCCRQLRLLLVLRAARAAAHTGCARHHRHDHVLRGGVRCKAGAADVGAGLREVKKKKRKRYGTVSNERAGNEQGAMAYRSLAGKGCSERSVLGKCWIFLPKRPFAGTMPPKYTGLSAGGPGKGKG